MCCNNYNFLYFYISEQRVCRMTHSLSLILCIFILKTAFVASNLEQTTTTDTNNTFTLTESDVRITGFSVVSSDADVSYDDRSVPEFKENTKATLRLYGHGITKETSITFTVSHCDQTFGQGFLVNDSSVTENSALVDVLVPVSSDQDYHMCTKDGNNTVVEQTSKNWLLIRSDPVLMPLWLTIIVIVVCLTFSALFSGLNLGLLALDKTEIKILINTGNKDERKYAKIIQPVRNRGNFLLCSILLGNVLVNSINAALFGSLTTGVFAVAFSTILIVIFGEVIPQAICSRYGLLVGAKTIFITKALMVITFPLSYPTSAILDCILGEEIGNVYSRERLKELLRVTNDGNDLDKDEVNIISGALDMKKKTVADIMTKIENVFMLSYDAILDYDTIGEIMKSGYSRIPVYDGNRHNVQRLLLIKDLALVDPADNTPLRTLCEFYQNFCYFVFEDVTLATVFRQFKTGQHGHMAFVRRISNEGDPNYETVGLVTMEDVIEELIQSEIMDETDIIGNHVEMARFRQIAEPPQSPTAFSERRELQRLNITPQLSAASFQYLSTCVEAFKSETISPTILNRLLKQDVVFQIKCKGKDKNDPSLVIFEQGKPADYFVLILEGRVEVTVGIDGLTFECGPFTFFGSDALVQNIGGVEPKDNNNRNSVHSLNLNAILKHTFEPDYSVKAIKDVLYIVIKRNLYMAAVRATLMERSQKVEDHHISNEPIDEDVKVFLNSLDEDYKTKRANDAANQLLSGVNSSNGVPTESVAIRYEPENDTVQMNLPAHI